MSNGQSVEHDNHGSGSGQSNGPDIAAFTLLASLVAAIAAGSNSYLGWTRFKHIERELGQIQLDWETTEVLQVAGQVLEGERIPTENEAIPSAVRPLTVRLDLENLRRVPVRVDKVTLETFRQEFARGPQFPSNASDRLLPGDSRIHFVNIYDDSEWQAAPILGLREQIPFKPQDVHGSATILGGQRRTFTFHFFVEDGELPELLKFRVTFELNSRERRVWTGWAAVGPIPAQLLDEQIYTAPPE